MREDKKTWYSQIGEGMSRLAAQDDEAKPSSKPTDAAISDSIRSTFDPKQMEAIRDRLARDLPRDASFEEWARCMLDREYVPKLIWDDGSVQHPLVGQATIKWSRGIGEMPEGGKKHTKLLPFPSGATDGWPLSTAPVWPLEMRVILFTMTGDGGSVVMSSTRIPSGRRCINYKDPGSDGSAWTCTCDSLLQRNDFAKPEGGWQIFRHWICGVYLTGIDREALAALELAGIPDSKKNKKIKKTLVSTVMFEMLNRSRIDAASQRDVARALRDSDDSFFWIGDETWNKILDRVPGIMAASSIDEERIRIKRYDKNPWGIAEKGTSINVTMQFTFVQLHRPAPEDE